MTEYLRFILNEANPYIVAGCVVLACLFFYIIYDFFRNPFSLPRYKEAIDLSGRRKPDYEECIDDWINDLHAEGLSVMDIYYETYNDWVDGCKRYLEHTCFWREHKQKTFNTMKKEVGSSDYEMFKFIFFRNHTRYRQQNYVKHPYTVHDIEYKMFMTLHDVMVIADELEEIDFETTRTKYYAKNQRKLMTKGLRQKIIERDNYTCQICGKYMPDEVGLHVDHIIPIKKGGKSVESNLQVLCDKCNLSKGKK